MNYTEKMKRIGEIVVELEKGGVDLDMTLKLFEEGSDLLKKCQEELKEVEGKIESLRVEEFE